MLNRKIWVKLSFAAVASFSIIMAGCFNNPVDPISGGSSGSVGAIPVNSSDVTTSSITAGYSQASNQGVYVSVRDQDGNALDASYFNNANFSVSYNGAMVPAGSISVGTASGAGQSISSSLVLDYSGSMGSQDITDMENAAVTFVNNMQAADSGEIVKFGTSIVVEQTYTADKSALITAINGITSASGRTALFDAIWQGTTDTNGQTGQRAVVAFTDGEENQSTTYPLSRKNDLIQDVRATGIPIYTIGLGLTPGSSEEQDLMDIANQTNGVYYYAPNSSDLSLIYQRIAQVFNNTLIISWPSFVYHSGYSVTISVTYSCSTGTYTSTFTIVLP